MDTKHAIGETAEADIYNSDGIARVHGMGNVQAEELVEYVINCYTQSYHSC
jgi:hypothetical protein